MKPRYTPYIFLSLLLLVATLIIGVRIGKMVEEKNKLTNLTLSITPAATSLSPAPTEILSFQTYDHAGCGLNFTIPSTLTAQKESSEEATLVDKKDTSVVISCKKISTNPTKTTEPVATSEVKLSNQTLVGTISTLTEGKEMISFTVRNPRNGKTLTLTIDHGLLPLFEKTVEFSN